MPGTDIFPSLHCCTKLSQTHGLFDVKFYPYPTANNDQIFAVVGWENVYICRPTIDSDSPFELLGWFKLQNHSASLNSLLWTKDPITRKPVLCVTGSSPKQILVLDVDTGKPTRSLAGHGKGINDLAVSPLSTDLIASGSEDYTIRLWNLHPKFENQPCVAIFGGEGHKQPILAIHFHPNGKWLLSGGIDTAVCLWAVPSLKELDRTDDELNRHNEPKIVYYPHFYSTEVHHNYVDCLQFYGDLIISRASQTQNNVSKPNEIIIWKIEGFDPNDPPPTEPPIPEPDVHTRSSFQPSGRSHGFQRLLTFDVPKADRFYNRFGLLHSPGMHPILCIGNQETRYLFWDLQRLEEGWDPADDKRSKKKGKNGKTSKTGPSSDNLNRLGDLRRPESVPSDGAGGATPMPSSTSNSALSDRKLTLSDPFLPLKPHAVIAPKTSLSTTKHFGTSQMAWSPDGLWLVAVGDFGMMCIFHRDKGVVNGLPKAVVDGTGPKT